MTEEPPKHPSAAVQALLESIDNSPAMTLGAQMESIRQSIEPTMQITEMLREFHEQATAPAREALRAQEVFASAIPNIETFGSMATKAASQASLSHRMSALAQQAEMPPAMLAPLREQEEEADQVQRDIDSLREEGHPTEADGGGDSETGDPDLSEKGILIQERLQALEARQFNTAFDLLATFNERSSEITEEVRGGRKAAEQQVAEARQKGLESTQQWRVSTWITVGSLAVAVLALFGALPQGIAAIPDAWDVIRGNW